MNKFMIYEMNVARSVEYSVARYVKNLEDGGKAKIIVQDISGSNTQSNIKESANGPKVTKLAKVVF
jgi:hypothetical protein